MRWSTATFVALLALVACASPPPSPPSEPTSSPDQFLSGTPPAETQAPATPSPTTAPAPTAALYFVAEEVLFSGTPSTFAVGAELGGNKVAVAQATVDFGDGTAPASGSSPCTSGANRVELRHAYAAAGRFTVSITSAALCEPAEALDTSEAARVLVLSTATGVAATWPRCTTFQLHMSGVDKGSSLSNGGALFLLENVSSQACTLDGYPSIQFVAGTGALLTTLVTQATTGDYLFPTISPGLVALAPGGYAGFEAGYADIPFGSTANATQDVACPTARWVRIILPETHQFGTSETTIAPCNGWLNVSAIFPGRDWISFQ